LTRAVPAYFYDDQRDPPGGPEGRKGILFVAGFGHPPNVDAAEWLVNEIMPRVRREIADAHLWLVGSNPTPAVQQLASEAVTVTGYVSDGRLDEFYRTARVAVVPLRFGAGVKSKVIEAMHHGLPLVTTPTGAQGLVDLDAAIPISDQADRIAQEVVSLMRDDGRWRDVASAGRRYISTRFSRAAMREIFALDIEIPRSAADAAPAVLGEGAHR
jgi:glycosyltransferase involved in cell wall biosynthesis